MNVKALLHDSPSDPPRRPRHDTTDNNSHWSQRQPPSPPPRPPLPPSAQPPPSTHPSPAIPSLRPIDSPRPGIDQGANPATVAPITGVGRRIPTPIPLTLPSSVTGHGIWGPDKSSGSDFLKERDAPRDLGDWDRVQRDRGDQRRDQLRDRERPGLHPPLPPPLTVFGDPPRRKNIAMEVNGPLAGPGIPLGPGIPGPDDLAVRSHPSGSSSRRPSISNSTIDVGKKMASPTEDEIRGRESQRGLQEIQLKERSVREPSRERERENWENDHAYQRNGPRKIIKAYNPYAPEQTRDYRYINSGLDGPGISSSGEYRSPYRMQPLGQPPLPPPHPSMRDGGRTTPKAEVVVLNRSNVTGPPVTPSERDRERDSGGPLLNERDRERMERDRPALHSQYGDRDREWEREHSIHMGYPDGDRERGPPPPTGNVPPHSSHPSLPPPLSHGHGNHSHPHSHSHSHGHSHHHHHPQHREQGSHSHSHHGHHHHQPPGSHKGPPHPHGHSSSRHLPQLIHHPQPQPPGQIQLLPHPQQQHSHGHVPHPHIHAHPSQPPPPSHPSSSQPHSPHPSHMHGQPPSQPHPPYRSQPLQPPAAGPVGGEMSPHHHHHHHHHHHLTPPTHPSTHHHPSSVPPPSQRQLQNQFHTQFVPGISEPGSRIGSPAPGPIPHHHQQQQQRVQVPPQSQSVTPSVSGPLPSHQQQQLPPGSKCAGLGLNGVPGLDPVDADNNVAAKRDSPRLGKKALAGIKTEDVLDKNGGRRSYMDIDEIDAVEEGENDVGHIALTDSEESEEEREFKAKVQVNLGTFVYPRLPFPYFFDLGRGIAVRGKKRDDDGESKSKEAEAGNQEVEKIDQSSAEVRSTEKTEKNDENGAVVDKYDDAMNVDDKGKNKDADKDLLDLETRVTVIIPNGHIPLKRPLRPKVWGGGLSDRPQDSSRDAKAESRVNFRRNRNGKRGQLELPTNSSEDKHVATTQKRRRRIYTDDSDLFLCALHSGWLTWSGAIQAKANGKDIKLDLRVIRCCGGAGGARLIEGVTGKEEVVGRFLGGCGEKCFNDAGKVQRPREERMNEKKGKKKENENEDKDGDRQPDTTDVEDSAEDNTSDSDDDGRGLTSAAWGSGHDGSAIEVLGVEFLEKAIARTSPGLGLRNRAQRMWEYSERRMTILGVAMSNACGPFTRLAGRKRRHACDWQLSYPRRLPNATIMDVIPECEEDEDRRLAVDDDNPEERIQMNIHTVVFGIGKMSTGFKYVPSVLQDVLFPGSSASTLDRQPKRRKVDDIPNIDTIDVQPSAQRILCIPPRPVVLLTGSEQYLLSPCTAEEAAGGDLIKYDVSLFVSSQAAESATATNGNDQDPKPKADIKLLKSGIGEPLIRFLREEIVIEEDLQIPICRWYWGASSAVI